MAFLVYKYLFLVIIENFVKFFFCVKPKRYGQGGGLSSGGIDSDGCYREQ